MTLLAKAAGGIPRRHPELFHEFLRRGYGLVRLSNADRRHDDAATTAKLALGCLITAVDDLADHPEHVDVRGLERAAALLLAPARLFSPESDLETLLLTLRDEMQACLRKLPGYERLGRIFAFDLAQIVNANLYHQLVTKLPALGNGAEMRAYGPYNMGMIAAHMIDLMTIRDDAGASLGRDREVFHAGQRHGRISNMLTTLARETREGDVTSELLNPNVLATRADLSAEQTQILGRISRTLGTSFDAPAYARGLDRLRSLHDELADRL